ncbi:hypothetical protein GF314_17400 [bacterium]|nr:hypothetical protein [bacterium]
MRRPPSPPGGSSIMSRRALLIAILTAGVLVPRPGAGATEEWAFTLTDPDRPGRTVPVTAIGPAVASGPCPVLALGHATMTPWTEYRALAGPLAEAGWLVLLPDTENGMQADQGELADDLLLAVAAVQDGEAALPVGMPEAGPDWALAGHSLGGGAAIVAAARRTPDAVVALAPQERARPSMIAHAGAVAAPVLVISGELDCITPPGSHHWPLHEALAATPRAMVTLHGAGHCYFAAPCEPCVGAESGCPPEVGPDAHRERTLALMQPWLAWHVRGDAGAHAAFLEAADAPWCAVDLVDVAAAAPVVPAARLRLLGPSIGAPVTRWRLELPDARPVVADVFDVRGRRVRRLVDGLAADRLDLLWSGQDDAGRRVPAGVYLLRVRDGRDVLSSRVVRLD